MADIKVNSQIERMNSALSRLITQKDFDFTVEELSGHMRTILRVLIGVSYPLAKGIE